MLYLGKIQLGRVYQGLHQRVVLAEELEFAVPDIGATVAYPGELQSCVLQGYRDSGRGRTGNSLAACSGAENFCMSLVHCRIQRQPRAQACFQGSANDTTGDFTSLYATYAIRHRIQPEFVTYKQSVFVVASRSYVAVPSCV